MKIMLLLTFLITCSGCSVFGKTKTESPPYSIIQSDEAQNIEVRKYDRLVLVSSPMEDGMFSGRNQAFSKLFKYISGDNAQQSKVSMTTPVFMDEAAKQSVMSFVLPASYTLKTAPVPQDSEVTLSEVKDYQVAVITFSGLLGESKITQHRNRLEAWIKVSGYEITGTHQAAAYDPPFTIPMLRRNEVFIPVKIMP